MSREAFEKWAEQHSSLERSDLLFRQQNGKYHYYLIEGAWQAWQAAYAAGQERERERAARVCLDIKRNLVMSCYSNIRECTAARDGAEMCAAAIRRGPEG